MGFVDDQAMDRLQATNVIASQGSGGGEQHICVHPVGGLLLRTIAAVQVDHPKLRRELRQLIHPLAQQRGRRKNERDSPFGPGR